MNNQEILDFVARFHYATLYVSKSPKSKRCGPGHEQWKQDLAVLNEAERLSLIEFYTAYREPIQFAGYIKGLATHFEIEEVEEE